ncbi:MAG: hypothetical protein K6F52_02605 [Clostridia bacterium]|nr:hypothetical protein [Clostridia bacterium]
MTKRTKVLIYIFIPVLIALYGIIYVVPGVTGALTDTKILEYGTLRVTDEVTCYIVRNEKVHMAPVSGNIGYYIKDGALVKKGTQVLTVDGAALSESEANAESKYGDITQRLGGDGVSTDFTADAKGVVSYYVDGYENVFSPENMKNLKYEEVKDYSLNEQNLVRNTTKKGEPLFKVCDSSNWHIICWVKEGNVSKYSVGRKVSVEFPESEITATVSDMIPDGDMWLVVLDTNRYYENFGKLRKQDATIVTSNYSGIIIENSSMATSGPAVGVYVKSKSGEYEFTPVKVITTDGTNSLVEVSYYYDEEGKTVNTVEIYDEILRKP